MSVTLYVPGIVCVVGCVLYCVVANAKVSALALHMFWVGLIVTLLHLPR